MTRAVLEALRADLPTTTVVIANDEPSALRRIATLVARSTPPSEVFAAVAEEMARCLGTTDAEVFRYEPDGAAVVVASYSRPALQGPASASV